MLNSKEIKCSHCAELEGCYKGQHGGKINCPCYCPATKNKMTVILINEEFHGLVDIATDYASAIDCLIVGDWLYGKYLIYDEETESYRPIENILGPNWEEEIMSWDIKKFNEFFDGHFYLTVKEVYERTDI